MSGVGRKAGRKPAFAARDVVSAALDEGIDGFTMSGVATRVGVVTAAIYRLFSSREEIVVACLDHIAAGIRLPSEGDDWQAVLWLWADECWRMCEEFPGLSRVVYSYAPAFTRIEHVLSEYARCLAVHDKTSRQAMFALDFIGDTVFASHLGVSAWRTADDNGNTGLALVRKAISEDSLVEPTEAWLSREVLDTKIDFIVSGLHHRWPGI
ncbi:MAG: TetR/AcrR family transcriptional regulator [Rhodococcus sp. (in: high G+C Gram-positive bacteria)]